MKILRTRPASPPRCFHGEAAVRASLPRHAGAQQTEGLTRIDNELLQAVRHPQLSRSR